MLDAPPAESTPVVDAEDNQDDETGGDVFGRRVVTVPAVLPMAGMLRAAVDRFMIDHPGASTRGTSSTSSPRRR